MTEQSFDKPRRLIPVRQTIALLTMLILAGNAATQDEKKPLPAKDGAPIQKPEVQAPKHKAEYAQEYFHSFKGDQEIGPEFHWHGLEPQGCLAFEPTGLRISLPTGHEGKRMGTGIGINTLVKGDFEVTLRYEILKEPEPKDAGAGSGVFVWVDLDTPKLNRGLVGRRTERGKQFVSWHFLFRAEPQKPVNVLRNFPANEPTGRLRLVRSGSMLYHYGAESASEEFTLLVQHPYGTEDLQAIRWGGETGGPKASLEARFLDLRIRADGLPDLPAIAPALAPRQQVVPIAPAPRSTLAMALGGGLAIALAFAVVLAFVLYRRRGTELAPAQTQAPSASFPCPDCGKKLKSSARLVGKKVKCPQCGQAVLVTEPRP